MKTEFDELIVGVLQREGGYVDHPADRGGPTNKGITQRVYDEWRRFQKLNPRPVKRLTEDEAFHIYFRNYWSAARCMHVPPEVREIHFDAAVNHGVTRALKLLQTAAQVTPDGVIGPSTLAAVAAMPPQLLRARYIAARYKFYGDIIQRDRSQLAFMAGWMNRMDEFAA